MEHHDALEFPDGQFVLLTTLSEGQQAMVLQLPAQPTTAAESAAQQRALTSADSLGHIYVGCLTKRPTFLRQLALKRTSYAPPVCSLSRPKRTKSNFGPGRLVANDSKRTFANAQLASCLDKNEVVVTEANSHSAVTSKIGRCMLWKR